tara:strand:- start:44 stop:580 length:537 start_codon:yes stop_codon:yes gene_type:complete
MSSGIKVQHVIKPTPVFTSVLEDRVKMNKYLKQVILEHREKYPKSNTSNVKAWHSDWKTHEINPKFQPILDRSLEAVNFINKNYFHCKTMIPYISEMWAMMYENNNFAKRHSHNTCIFVAVYYVDVGDGCSPLKFQDDTEIVPENGMLIIWPGMLHHEVPPTKEKRMCISMNFKHKEL